MSKYSITSAPKFSDFFGGSIYGLCGTYWSIHHYKNFKIGAAII
jgi:hypothetical protein